MEHKFMQGVWERVERLEQAEALLSAEPTRQRKAFRLLKPAAAAAAALTALVLVAFTPSLAAKYQEWLRGPQSVYLDQDASAVDQGIEVQALAGFSDASTAELLFKVRDVQQDRLGGDWLKLEHEWVGGSAEAGWGRNRLYGLRYLEYDEKERSWLFRAELETSEIADFDGLSLQISQLCPVRRTESRSYPFAELPLGRWIAAPGDEAPAELGITVYSSEFTSQGLTLTASVPLEHCGVEVRLLDRDGRMLMQSRSVDEDPQTITFPEVTGETVEGMSFLFEFWYEPETITGNWSLPIRIEPTEERIVQANGQTLFGKPIREAAVSKAMVRLLIECPSGSGWEDFPPEAVPSEDIDILHLYLKDGTEYTTDQLTRLDWENDWEDPETTKNYLYKWRLEERIDPSQAERLEVLGQTIWLR